jgi:hypothetical protein
MRPVALTAVLAVAAWPAATPADDALADFVLTGFLDSRLRLKTGICEVIGTKSQRETSFDRLDGEVRLFVAFDHDAGLLRFDRREPVRIGRTSGLPEDARPPADWHVGVMVGKSVKTPSRSLLHLSHAPDDAKGGALMVHKPDFRLPVQSGPFDLRAVGAVSTSGYTSGGRIEGLYNGMKSNRGMRVTVDGRAYRLVYPSPHSNSVLSWEFDGGRQFVAVRHEVRPLAEGGSANRWPFFESTTEWQRQAGLQVPARLRTHDERSADNYTTYDLAFIWRSVNEPVPPELFQPNGMDLPAGLPIITNVSGNGAVSLGKVGDLMPHPSLLADPPVPSDPRGWLGRNRLAVTVAVVLVATTGGFLTSRRRRRELVSP